MSSALHCAVQSFNSCATLAVRLPPLLLGYHMNDRLTELPVPSALFAFASTLAWQYCSNSSYTAQHNNIGSAVPHNSDRGQFYKSLQLLALQTQWLCKCKNALKT